MFMHMFWIQEMEVGYLKYRAGIISFMKPYDMIQFVLFTWMIVQMAILCSMTAEECFNF